MALSPRLLIQIEFTDPSCVLFAFSVKNLGPLPVCNVICVGYVIGNGWFVLIWDGGQSCSSGVDFAGDLFHLTAVLFDPMANCLPVSPTWVKSQFLQLSSYTQPFVSVTSYLSLGCTRDFLNIMLGLNPVAMLCFWNTLWSFSEDPCT